MKRTNKLLAGLAISLFVVTISILVIEAKSSRVDTQVYQKMVALEAESFQVADRYFVRMETKNFAKVSISGADNASLRIHLVNSADYGYKISKGFSDKLIQKVEDDGHLSLHVKDSVDFFNATIYIFAPRFEELTMTSIDVGEIVTDLDSLKITLNDIDNTRIFGANNKLKSLFLTLNSSQSGLQSAVEKEALSNLNDITLTLTNSSFALDNRKYNKVNATLDNSGLSYLREKGEQELFIEELNVNAYGNSTVGFFEGNQIGKFGGSLSDSTSVLMPVYLYKNLFLK